MRAKIFLSCGQQHDTDEPAIAKGIAQCLETEFGFECYVAVAEQSLIGLRENLFRQLETSEYFIFIDFKREGLHGRDHCRGSLFSHQELAIASYLKIDAMIFQEKGVHGRDGMLGCFQGNATGFENRKTLVDEVRKKVAEKLAKQEWSSSWKNGLTINLSSKLYEGQIYGLALQLNENRRPLAHFHLEVRNQHWRKHAQHCFIYLQKVHDLKSDSVVNLETTELKWAGSVIPDVIVAAGRSRRFDAFQIYPDKPDVMSCKSFSDSTEFTPCIRGVGVYRLTYAVRCANFPDVEQSFEVAQTGDYRTLTIKPV